MAWPRTPASACSRCTGISWTSCGSTCSRCFFGPDPARTHSEAMMAATETQGNGTSLAARWSGGRSPWDVSWGKLMMWLFLISDAMTFAGLLIGLWVTRLASPAWPNHLPGVVNLPFVATMTVVLICSSTTMAMSVYALRRGQRREAVWLLAATIVAGLLFAGMQAREWSHFIGDGARLT